MATHLLINRCVVLLRRCGVHVALLLAVWFGGVSPVVATPTTPASDSDVLEVLPTQWQTTALSRLQAQHRADPNDLTTVAALVRLYVETARTQSDPRYLGYAQTLLQPWWDAASPPMDLLLLRATLRQHNHDYAAAVQDLQQLVQQYPNNTQGWLTLAQVQLVQGNYAAAKTSCKALANHAATWYATLCYSQVMSLTGEAQRAYSLQQTLLPAIDNKAVELRQWVETLAGETAWRLGETAQAEQHFKAALTQPRRDPYLLRVYSDFLLSQQRPEAVLKLLTDATQDDALLLRLAIASRDAQQPTVTAQYRAWLDARYQAASLRGSTLHRYDEALYLLAFSGDGTRALQLAQANWELQKESVDTQLLLQAALQQGDKDAAKAVHAWLLQHHQQDARLQPWLDQLARKDLL